MDPIPTPLSLFFIAQPEDFFIPNPVVTLIPGVNISCLNIFILDDSVLENNETVLLKLESLTEDISTVINVTGNENATVTIIDNDCKFEVESLSIMIS